MIENLSCFPDPSHCFAGVRKALACHMEYDLVQQQDQLLIQSLLGQFAEYSLPVGGIKNFGFCDRAAVDQPEGFIQVDVDLDPADEILRVVPGCQLLQSGNEKGISS